MNQDFIASILLFIVGAIAAVVLSAAVAVFIIFLISLAKL